MEQHDLELQQEQERAQEERAREKESGRDAAFRAQHLDQLRAEQNRQGQEPEPEHKSLADTPAPEIPQPETQRGGMERELRLDTGLRRETAQWSMDGFKLAGEQQAAGMTPFARSLADEPAPDLSAVERQPEQQARQIEQEHQREQER
jgi:hypothetical protein